MQKVQLSSSTNIALKHGLSVSLTASMSSNSFDQKVQQFMVKNKTYIDEH